MALYMASSAEPAAANARPEPRGLPRRLQALVRWRLGTCSDLRTATHGSAHMGSRRLAALMAASDEILEPLKLRVTHALDGVRTVPDTYGPS